MSELSAQRGGAFISGLVALGDAATTVITAVDIQQYDRFTIYSYNAGGGSGDAVSNVTLESAPEDTDALYTAVDASVLSGPLAADGVEAKSFSAKSLKYIRLTAKCAVGEDTTVKFWISVGADL